MIALVEIIAALFVVVTDADINQLRSTAPMYLKTDAIADQHLRAARAAAFVTGTDADMLLAIAHHESRYVVTEATPETNGYSCGVMTPEPTQAKGACLLATSSMAAGYFVGAAHLAGWLRACNGRVRCALNGYAGGYRLIRFCAEHEKDRRCTTPDVFLQRARWIRGSTSGTRRSRSTS